MRKKAKYALWWFFAVSVLLICIVLQIPAAWLMNQFNKNNQNFYNVVGNVWNGQADWEKGQLKGTIHWHYRPLDLLLFKVSSHVQLYSDKSQLEGIVGYRLGDWIFQSIEGEISPDTLRKLNSWRWPNSTLFIHDFNTRYRKKTGFENSSGQLQWQGGELVYRLAMHQEQMLLPALNGQFLSDQGKLIADIRNQKTHKMLYLVLDANGILDLQVTQRMMQHASGYTGQAAIDSYVISMRQPLIKGRMQ
ncbi:MULTISPECIES: type II secretion system protein N [unclassified Acinetobacter]|uniref:type II secretion system protein N n=1 Tax=unclassified Acinetobacter TaxID=196816 RepID=UPI002934F801|nr:MULTISPECIES: type II secretion system protein N [unclassified Acinetobacter]WOE30645.1 type II secretion system protein N [Acinetobacter sp. SAAs470]WOE38837.1 type II secretion system protein N [Acinetobacter sp. SAAs474]